MPWPHQYAVTRRRHQWLLAALDLFGAAVVPPWRRRPPAPERVRSVLLIRWERLGDVVTLEPAIARARALFPQARLTWLVSPAYAGFARELRLVDEVWSPASRWRALWTRRQSFDVAVEFHADPRWIVVARRHARVVVGEGIRGGGFLLDLEAFSCPGERAAARAERLVEAAANVRRGMGRSPQLAPAPEWTAAARPLLRLLPRNFVVIHAGAGQPAKRWPLARWRALATECGRRGWMVVLTGGPEDGGTCTWIAAQAGGRCRNFSGQTSLEVLAALVLEARCVVAADTGVIHLAQALGTPTVALFGPTDPAVWGYATARHRSLAFPLPCAPCDRGVCPRLPRDTATRGEIAPCLAALQLPPVIRALEEVTGAAAAAWKRPSAAAAWGVGAPKSARA